MLNLQTISIKYRTHLHLSGASQRQTKSEWAPTSSMFHISLRFSKYVQFLVSMLSETHDSCFIFLVPPRLQFPVVSDRFGPIISLEMKLQSPFLLIKSFTSVN